MNRSSTSSSNPLITRAGVLAIAMLAGFRVLMAAWPATFDRSEDAMCEMFRGIEVRAMANRANPRPVVFLGTSRLGPAAANATAEHLGLDNDAIVDYSYPATTFWWAAAFLRRNPDVWNNARVVVIDVLPFQLYENKWHSESSPQFLRYASLTERWRAPNPLERVRALSQLVLPVQTQSRSLAAWRASVNDALSGPADIHAPFVQKMQLELASPAAVLISPQSELRPLPRAFTDEALNFLAYVQGKSINETQRRAVQWIVENVPDGCHVLFIMPPILRHPEAVMAEFPDQRQRYTDFRDFMNGLQSDRVTVRFLEDPAAFGLGRDDFDDGIHFSATGMEKAGALLAAAIREAAPDVEARPR